MLRAQFAQLADRLDRKGLAKEANIIDRIILADAQEFLMDIDEVIKSTLFKNTEALKSIKALLEYYKRAGTMARQHMIVLELDQRIGKVILQNRFLFLILIKNMIFRQYQNCLTQLLG